MILPLGTKRLETERLILRKIQPADCDAMYDNWACREECSRYFPWPPANDRAAYRKRVSLWTEHYADGLYFQWIIEWKESHEVIGLINLHDICTESASAETSYVLCPAFWKQGIMTEALRDVLRYAFEEIGLQRVHADVFAENTASARVLSKCGMKKTHTLPGHYVKDEVPVTADCYAIERSEWKENQSAF